MLLAILLPTLIGYLILSVIYREKISLLEKLAVGFLFGSSILTIQMFIYSLCEIKYSVLNISLPWVLLSPLFIFADRKVGINIKKWSHIELLLFSLIGLKWLFVLFQSQIKPVVGWDAIWNFSLRAKIFFFERGIPLDKAHQFFLGGGMRQYPLQRPLLEAWSYLCMGNWDDIQMKIIFPLYFVALLTIFYKGLREEKSRLHSLFFTFLLSTLPILVYHTGIEYADFIAGVYFLSASIFLYRYFKNLDWRDLLTSGLLFAFCGWVKDEGIVFYFVAILIFLVLRKFAPSLSKAKEVLLFIIPMIALTVPWLVIKKLFGLTLGNSPDIALGKTNDYLSFHPDVFDKIFQKTFLTDNWHIFPIFLVITIAFFWKEIIKTEKRVLLYLFSGGLLFFIYLYSFTYNSGMIMNDIILSRNYLTYFPLGLFLTGIVFKLRD